MNLKRVIWTITLACALLFVLWSSWSLWNTLDQRESEAHETGQDVSLNIKSNLDSVFWSTEKDSEAFAELIAQNQFSEKELNDTIIQLASKHVFLSGITVAFEAGAFDSVAEPYGIYYDKSQNVFLDVDETYDYINDDLETTQWYRKPRESKHPLYIGPYFGEVAEQLVIDYAVPMYRGEDRQFVGVITFTISLNKLSEDIRSLVDGRSGYLFLTNKEGMIIAHPNRDFIFNRNIQDIEPIHLQDFNKEKLFQQTDGSIEHISPYTGVESILFFHATEGPEWKVAVVYSSTDLRGDPKELEQSIFTLCLSISSLLILILILLFHGRSTRSLWLLSLKICLIFSANMSLIWFVELEVDYSEELTNRTRVYSKDALQTFLFNKKKKLQQLGIQPYREIPTGIFISELEVSDSYDMGVSGKIWQKWPKNNDLEDAVGFDFDQALPGKRAVFVTLESKESLNDSTWLYTWDFSAGLKIFFDYRTYPLDQHYIDIRLSYPDPTAGIMLTPDFGSYEVLNPSAKPGISPYLFAPRFRTIASYFSFRTHPIKTYFGKETKLKTPEKSSLEYNIVIKRRFLTPFVSYVIPFILGSGIIFFLLFSLSNKEGDNSGVTIMGVVQGMSALFFGMLLAHINIRNRIPTPDITYLESFYFVIYTMIILLIIIVVTFKRNPNHKFFGYRDNLIVKITYWPLLVGLLYLLTLIRFF